MIPLGTQSHSASSMRSYSREKISLNSDADPDRRLLLLLFTLLWPTVATTSTTPAEGPYATTSTTTALPALDGSGASVLLTYPSNASTGERFPLIAYAHGMAGGGGVDIIGYHALFHQIASHGFVIAAHKSCSFGCKKPGGHRAGRNVEASPTCPRSTTGGDHTTPRP